MPNHLLDHIADWCLYLRTRTGELDFEIDEERGTKTKYQRQIQQLETFKNGRNNNILHNFLLFNAYNGPLKETDLPEPQTKTYTPIQPCFEGNKAFEAIQKALNAPELFFLQGPPGTGKTTSIVEIILQTLKENPHARILLTSETHIAVDNALERISTLQKETLGITMRYPNYRFSTGNQTEAQIKYEELLKQTPPDMLDILAETETTSTPLLSPKIPKWIGKSLCDTHQIIGVTCNQINHLIDHNSEPFDLTIIDECSKATLAEWILALNPSSKCILVGDHKQLPPTFCSEDCEILENLAAEQENLIRNGILDRLFENLPESRKATLTTQYRMIPEIGEYISTHFYAGKLEHARKSTDSPYKGFIWMDYKPSYPTPNPQNPDKTLENLREVRLIQEKIKEVRQNTNTKIAVITPYRAQCKLLKTCLGDIENCEISTIDAYQGQEADILFFSFVRTTGTAIFYAEDRRLNVAISRAKNAVFLVGSRNYIQSQYRYKTLKALTELNTN